MKKHLKTDSIVVAILGALKHMEESIKHEEEMMKDAKEYLKDKDPFISYARSLKYGNAWDRMVERCRS